MLVRFCSLPAKRNQARASLTGFLNFAVNTSVGQPRSRPGGYVGSDRIQLLANELEKTRYLLGPQPLKTSLEKTLDAGVTEVNSPSDGQGSAFNPNRGVGGGRGVNISGWSPESEGMSCLLLNFSTSSNPSSGGARSLYEEHWFGFL